MQMSQFKSGGALWSRSAQSRSTIPCPACTRFQTIPNPASTEGGFGPSQPLPRFEQHQCFFEGDHASKQKLSQKKLIYNLSCQYFPIILRILLYFFCFSTLLLDISQLTLYTTSPFWGNKNPLRRFVPPCDSVEVVQCSVAVERVSAAGVHLAPRVLL